MPGYIPNVLHKFQRSTPKRPHRSPYNIQPHKPFIKGNRQYAPEPDSSPLLDADGTTRVQSIAGSLLYYARAIDGTLLPALKTSKPTQATLQRCHDHLD